MIVEPLHLNLDLVDPAASQLVHKIITLTNSHPHRMAFKIRTTMRERYSTTPNSGLLEPGQEVDIVMCMTPLTREQFDAFSSNMNDCPDKFLVRCAPADESTTEEAVRGAASEDWWNSRPKADILDQIITCSFVRQTARMEVAQAKLRFVKEKAPGRTVGSSQVLAEEILQLVNNSPQRQAFKIRTTARDRYRVEPSCGILDNGKTCPVRISMVMPHSGTGDKFQVRCAPVEEGTTEAAVRNNDWWSDPAHKARIYDATLDSMLVAPAEPSRPLDESKRSEVSVTSAPRIEASDHLADDGSYDYLFKIVLIGDSNVGKTSLLTRFSDDTFTDSFIATVGVDFRVRTIQINGKVVKLQIWDTAGQERFRTITSAYYRGADGIGIIYDITSQDSFDHVETWLQEITKFTHAASVSRLVIGNKCDKAGQRAVREDQAQEYCYKHGLKWIETSAKTSTRVDEAFSNMVSEILQIKAKESAGGGGSSAAAGGSSLSGGGGGGGGGSSGGGQSGYGFGVDFAAAMAADQRDGGVCSCLEAIFAAIKAAVGAGNSSAPKGYAKH